MFIFVRRAKAHSELETLGGLEAAELAEKCLKSWSSGGGDPWREWFPESDDGKTEFVDTWERIKWPRAALDDAKVSAARLPLKPFRCYSVKYGQFVSVAGYLQRSVNGPILLPCRKMATLLECDAMTVSRYRRLAVQDGLLRLTARGIKAQRKADEFSFATESFNWKTGEQIFLCDSKYLCNIERDGPRMLHRKAGYPRFRKTPRYTRNTDIARSEGKRGENKGAPTK
jgi:hypothetical protein